jgi:HTH-type transcriptional regulator/antitoxin HipB
MRTLQEVGQAVATTRRTLRLKQKDVAAQAGMATEFGTRKLLAVLAVLGLELTLKKAGTSGSLDELRLERGGA